jgi:hypothetical protein
MSEARRAEASADLNREDALRQVKESLSRIQYGSILITIHQGEVVGIETSTKVRLKGGEATPS